MIDIYPFRVSIKHVCRWLDDVCAIVPCPYPQNIQKRGLWSVAWGSKSVSRHFGERRTAN